jgi:arylformamidase
MQIIDLSVPLDSNTPVYPGDPAPRIEPAAHIEKDGYTDHLISIGTHLGTHIDAPLHMIAGGKNLSDFPVEIFVGRGKLVEVSDGNFDAVKSAGIERGDIVLLHTGMSDKFHDPVYFESYPAMPQEVAAYLVETGVKMIGLDTCSTDNQDDFPIHKTLLAANVLIIENLTNLETLAGKKFTVYALPLKLEIDGSPARVIAKID